MTIDDDTTDQGLGGSNLNSPVRVLGSCPFDDGTSSERPGDVLTDVILRLTFDNTAYVEQMCDDAEASALLPDSLSGNSLSIQSA